MREHEVRQFDDYGDFDLDAFLGRLVSLGVGYEDGVDDTPMSAVHRALASDQHIHKASNVGSQQSAA
jgi:hypothetical protein